MRTDGKENLMPATGTVPSGKGPVSFATVGKVIKPTVMKPAKVTALVGKIDLQTINAGALSLRTVKLQPRQVGAVMNHVYKTSPTDALKLSRAVLQHATSEQGHEDHARALFQWAQTAQQRQTVCTAFRQQKLGMVAVHQIGELTQTEARGYMKDYFAAG